MPGGSVVRLSNWRRAVFLPARARVGTSDRFASTTLTLMVDEMWHGSTCRSGTASIA
jgi:hypothetical protein